MSFSSPYKFQVSGRVVVLKHSHGGHIRVSPNNNFQADGNGGQGGWARWKIELMGSNHCRFQSTKTGKYLRIWRGGKDIDVNGGGGPFTKFRIHYHSRPNGIKLESDRFPGRYIAVNPGRGMKIGSGGHHCNLWIYKEGGAAVRVQPQVIVQPKIVNVASGGNQFNLAYMFRKNNTVCVRSNYGKHLRINPNNYSMADGNGGQGGFARWRISLEGAGRLRLCNTRSGKYLRIQSGSFVNCDGGAGRLSIFRYHMFQSPNGVKLESCNFPGKYIAIRPNGNVVVGTGGVHCKLFFMREGGAQPQVVIQQPIQPQVIVQRPQPQVIVQQPQQPQVIVQPQQTGPSQQEIVYQQQAQQAQLQAQNSQSQMQQMQQQMEQMKLQQEQQLAAQKQQMAQQQAALQQQQAQVLAAQESILQQQQAQLSNSGSNLMSPVSQNEGQSTQQQQPPYNPNVVQQQPVQQQAYPVLQPQQQQQQQPAVVQPVQPIQPQQPIEMKQEISSPKAAPLDLSDAEEVRQWLTSLKMERYYDTFIENGYDQLEAVGEITKEDLKEMGIALGHIKIIMGAYVNAPYANKEILVRSIKWNTYMSNYGPGKKMGSGALKVEINHKSKRNEGCVWIFEPIDNRMFYLKNKSTSTMLRILPEQNEDCHARDKVSPHAQLILEKVENEKGVFYIKCMSNGFYLSADQPSTFGKNDMKSVQQAGSREKFEFILLKKVGKSW